MAFVFPQAASRDSVEVGNEKQQSDLFWFLLVARHKVVVKVTEGKCSSRAELRE